MELRRFVATFPSGLITATAAPSYCNATAFHAIEFYYRIQNSISSAALAALFPRGNTSLQRLTGPLSHAYIYFFPYIYQDLEEDLLLYQDAGLAGQPVFHVIFLYVLFLLSHLLGLIVSPVVFFRCFDQGEEN